jgi:hypothetical protein
MLIRARRGRTQLFGVLKERTTFLCFPLGGVTCTQAEKNSAMCRKRRYWFMLQETNSCGTQLRCPRLYVTSFGVFITAWVNLIGFVP